jgi:hypothetical protein
MVVVWLKEISFIFPQKWAYAKKIILKKSSLPLETSSLLWFNDLSLFGEIQINSQEMRTKINIRQSLSLGAWTD